MTSGSALSVAPRLEWTEGLSRGVLEASYSRFSSGPWAVQAGFEAGTAYDVLGGALGLSAGANLNVLSGDIWSGAGRASLAFGHTLGPLVAGAGGGVSYVRSVTEIEDRYYSAVASLSAQGEAGQATLRAEYVWAPPANYTDGIALLSRKRGPLSLEAMAGARFFEQGPTEAVWQAGAAWQLGAPVALEASAGRWPTSPEGFARGLYASAGLRFMARSRAQPAMVVEPLGAGRVRVTIQVPWSGNIAIGGDWNEWNPVGMTNEGRGRWSIELPLVPGAHRFALRVGEEWRVPPGIPSMPDDFGGRVGLLVVS